jgi:voltage-gated potassium channel
MARRLTDLDVSRRRRETARMLASLLLVWSAVLGVYFLLGPAGHAGWTAAGVVVVGGLLFLASLTVQVRRIVAAEVPLLRAAQALGSAVVLFLALFASVYLSLPSDSFSRHLDHVGALYFTVTVFSTVGFGDITPETDTARMVVAGQMLLNLVIIGVLARVFVGVAQTGLTTSGDSPPGEDEPGSAAG